MMFKKILICTLLAILLIFAATAAQAGGRQLMTHFKVDPDWQTKSAKLSGPETGVTGQSYTFSVSSAMAGAGSFTYVVGILDGSYSDPNTADALLIYDSSSPSFSYTFYEPGLYAMFAQSSRGTEVWRIKISNSGSPNALTQAVAQAASACRGSSQYDTMVNINEYLCNKVTYDDTLTHFSAYDALVSGCGVCNSYSRAFKLVAEACGLSCKRITGKGNGVNHAWNGVKVDGRWYQVDTTWNDSTGERHMYLGLTDKMMSREHSGFYWVGGSQSCTSLKDNYFVRSGKWKNLAYAFLGSIEATVQNATELPVQINADMGPDPYLETPGAFIPHGGNPKLASDLLYMNGTILAYTLSRETMTTGSGVAVRGKYTFNESNHSLTATLTAADGQSMPDDDADPEPDSEPNPDPQPDPQPAPGDGQPAPGGEAGQEEQVTLKKIKISKLSSPSKKKVKVEWKALSKKVRKKAKRIEIQISTDKTFTEILKTKTLKSSKTSYTFSGLKKNTKYYVRIRVYTEEEGVKYVSPWSSVKKIKTKKK